MLEIAQSHQVGASTKYKEILCLKEMRKLIEEEQEGDNYLNRLLLIYITNDVLNRIFALEIPAKLRQYSKEIVPMDFELPRLWRCEDEADNIVWEFVPLNIDAYYLYRNEIDYKEKKIRFTKYQLTFKDIGYKDFVIQSSCVHQPTGTICSNENSQKIPYLLTVLISSMRMIGTQ